MLLERLKAGKKNKKTIKFPNTQEDVVISVLSESELQEAHFATERHFKKNGIEASMVTVDAYEAEKTTQVLFRALRDPLDETKAIAKTIDAFRGLIERGEKDLLVDEYTSLELESNGGTETMTPDEMESFFDALKKRPEILGSVSSIGTARQLISYLASRPQTSQPDSGSIS